VGGANLTKADREALEKVMPHQNHLSPLTHPNMFAWYRLASKFSAAVIAKW